VKLKLVNVYRVTVLFSVILLPSLLIVSYLHRFKSHKISDLIMFVFGTVFLFIGFGLDSSPFIYLGVLYFLILYLEKRVYDILD
jgi:hypothetical protein